MYGSRSNDETTSFMGNYIVQGIILLDVLTFFNVVIYFVGGWGYWGLGMMVFIFWDFFIIILGFI
jgi:hypothetical protein